MTNKRNFLIKESLKRKLLSKWFLGINIILFLLIMISFNIDSIITFFGGDFKEEKTVIVSDNANIYADFKEEFSRISEVSVTDYQILKSNETIEKLKKIASNDKNTIIVEINPSNDNIIEANYYSLQGISTLNQNIISSSLNNAKKKLALKKFGITEDKLSKIEKNVQFESIILSKQAVNENKDISAAITVIVFVIPSFFLITTLVQLIGSEINEEKTTKSMEIIISNVPAKDHLLSKIIACTIFTFLQIVLLLLFVLIASLIHPHQVGTLTSSTTQGFATSILSNLITDSFLMMVERIAPILIISLIITFITYALLAGVLASMTTNIDDFQQLQMPLMMVISASFYLSLLAALFEGSFFIKVMAFIPLISFMVSPTLFILGQISFISVLISVILEFIFLLLVYHYGIKIYRVGILNYSGEHLWRKIIKAIKTNEKY